jgi:hypothetical protein
MARIEAGSIPIEAGSIPIEAGSIPIEAGSIPIEAGLTSSQGLSSPKPDFSALHGLQRDRVPGDLAEPLRWRTVLDLLA